MRVQKYGHTNRMTYGRSWLHKDSRRVLKKIEKRKKIHDYEGPKIRTHQQNDKRTDRLAMKYVK